MVYTLCVFKNLYRKNKLFFKVPLKPVRVIERFLQGNENELKTGSLILTIIILIYFTLQQHYVEKNKTSSFLEDYLSNIFLKLNSNLYGKQYSKTNNEIYIYIYIYIYLNKQ